MAIILHETFDVLLSLNAQVNLFFSMLFRLTGLDRIHN